MGAFIGRKHELKTLQIALDSGNASFIVVNGRRRIGKSRLIEEFAKPFRFYKFSGLAPRPGITSQDQRKEFMRQFSEHFNLPIAGINDWGNLFSLLAKQTQRGRTVILLDEISWMALGDPDFLGKLKIAWDDYFSKNSKLILFLCGSVSSWIEDNLLSSTAFLGRPTLHMTIKELPLSECNLFWSDENNLIASYEKLKFLSVSGGIPRYLELLNPKLTAEQNIARLFFKKESALYDEFKKIFVDIYGQRSRIYRAIVERLVDAPSTQNEITAALGKARSGDLSNYLKALTLGGFISKDATWDVATGKVSNLSYYRLSDNYLRFALKYILPNELLIEKGRFEDRSLKSLPAWDSIMGLQFENLVLCNHKQILRLLNISEEDVVLDNPFFQRKTKRMPGCQIDYMIQTRHDTVYVCEIKFSRNKVGSEIITEMQDKLERLRLPRNISKRAVLIHVNGVSEQVEDSLFFSNIIDFGKLLLAPS